MRPVDFNCYNFLLIFTLVLTKGKAQVLKNEFLGDKNDYEEFLGVDI